MIKIVSLLNIVTLGLFLNACSPQNKTEELVVTPTEIEETSKITTGVFRDSFVASLDYKCSSQTKFSLTNNYGEFNCNRDDNLSFSIGENFGIGQADMATDITPLTLYPENAIKVLNLIQLLQTLDKDLDTSNGIELDNLLVAKLQGSKIALDDPYFDREIEALLGTTLISPEIAFSHFSKTLQSLGINNFEVDHTTPIFTSETTITLYEGQTSITQVIASDNAPLTYSINTLKTQNPELFTIESQTGQLSFTSPTTYNLKHEYSVTIDVTDGINRASQEFTIHILQKDENPSVINTEDTITTQENNIPVLAIIMNWKDYYETSSLEWYQKLFDTQSHSVATWYKLNSEETVHIIPVEETSGSKNDGIIMVDMQTYHPGSGDTTLFRDTYIRSAIQSSEVTENIDFSKYDTNNDNIVDTSELQILFIVAGGEESYGDNPNHSVWALSWAFDSYNAPVIDGVELMKYTGDTTNSGSFLMFGANHGDHSATIGIIAHELGHSIFNLFDYYDDGGGSGLGLYDIMSGGSWALKPSDKYSGETPTQFSIFNKLEAGFMKSIKSVDTTQTLTIKCSSNEGIKLTTQNPHEYFLIECRDTENEYSDASFISSDNAFSNKLFTAIYHVDDTKDSTGYFIHFNTESGLQTSYHHYNLALLEKDTKKLMTDTEGIEAQFIDVYSEGDFIASDRFKLYDGTSTDFNVEVIEENYNTRSVTLKIIK